MVDGRKSNFCEKAPFGNGAFFGESIGAVLAGEIPESASVVGKDIALSYQFVHVND